MAFMMPVMKNNFDIYKDGRTRKTSESSTGSSNSSPDHNGNVNGRIRRAVNSKADIVDLTPSQHFSRQHQENHMAYRMQMKRCQSANAFQRNGARSNNSVSSTLLSPSRSFSQTTTTTTTTTTSTTNKVVTKNNINDDDAKSTESNKFHLRLVEKIRRSFRKDNAKRT